MKNNNLPGNLLYNKDYSWVKINGKTATFGVIKPAADKVKEFVFIKLPKLGQDLKKGKTYVSLESIKWSGHLSSPLSGKVVEVHQELFDEPSIINQDPYGRGWIAKIKIADLEEKKDLFNAEQIRKWVEAGMKKD